jgi:hypothetical protein
MLMSFLALTAFCSAPVAVAAVSPAGSAIARTDSLASLYAGGQTWGDFFAAAKARRTLWVDNYEQGVPSEALLARARAVGGTWRFLVVAVDSCSDSANTIPYLARLVEMVPGLELRIVTPAAGKGVMEAHRTDDARAATPTVLLLDETFQERGCFVERPAALRRMLAEAGSDDEARYKRKMDWYQEDAGVATVGDLVALLEGAAAGAPVCDAKR